MQYHTLCERVKTFFHTQLGLTKEDYGSCPEALSMKNSATVPLTTRSSRNEKRRARPICAGERGRTRVRRLPIQYQSVWILSVHPCLCRRILPHPEQKNRARRRQQPTDPLPVPVMIDGTHPARSFPHESLIWARRQLCPSCPHVCRCIDLDMSSFLVIQYCTSVRTNDEERSYLSFNT